MKIVWPTSWLGSRIIARLLSELYDIMSRTLSRLFGHCLSTTVYARPLQVNSSFGSVLSIKPLQVACGGSIANYSKRNGPPPDAGEPFKTVSKSRRVDDGKCILMMALPPPLQLPAPQRQTISNAFLCEFHGQTILTASKVNPIGNWLLNDTIASICHILRGQHGRATHRQWAWWSHWQT